MSDYSTSSVILLPKTLFRLVTSCLATNLLEVKSQFLYYG